MEMKEFVSLTYLVIMYSIFHQCIMQVLNVFLLHLSNIAIIAYYSSHKKELTIDCSNVKLFAFCQEAYVFVVDFSTSLIYGFRREKCMDYCGIFIRFG